MNADLLMCSVDSLVSRLKLLTDSFNFKKELLMEDNVAYLAEHNPWVYFRHPQITYSPEVSTDEPLCRQIWTLLDEITKKEQGPFHFLKSKPRPNATVIILATMICIPVIYETAARQKYDSLLQSWKHKEGFEGDKKATINVLSQRIKAENPSLQQ
jgi:hypothetical protein